MENIQIFGYLAVATSFFTIAPQLIKTYKTKKADDVSILMWIALLITNSFWLLHGIAISDTPLIITNAYATIADLIMIVLKIRYDRENSKK